MAKRAGFSPSSVITRCRKVGGGVQFFETMAYMHHVSPDLSDQALLSLLRMSIEESRAISRATLQMISETRSSLELLEKIQEWPSPERRHE